MTAWETMNAMEAIPIPAATPQEHVIMLDKFRLDNQTIGKLGLVSLLTKRFPHMDKGAAWSTVSRYCNERNLCLQAGVKFDGQMRTTGKSKSLFVTLTNWLR